MKENPLAMKSGDAVSELYQVRLQYAALLSAFAKQERTMKEVAAEMRHVESLSRIEWRAHEAGRWADILDPREPVAEADAAEKFSQACEERKRS